MTLLFPVVVFLVFVFLAGIKIVRPTHRALIERLGKYNRFAEPGFQWVIPIVENIYLVNVTEQMVDAEPQEIITNDNLNAKVDAQVYFRVKRIEENTSELHLSRKHYQWQIVNLARTTLRNIIGTLTLKSANSERQDQRWCIRPHIYEDNNWASMCPQVKRSILQDVQETMNKVVKAENEKIAAIDFATATETAADGQKRAVKAEGIRQARILRRKAN